MLGKVSLYHNVFFVEWLEELNPDITNRKLFKQFLWFVFVVVMPKPKKNLFHFFCFQNSHVVEPNLNIKPHIHYFLALLTSCTRFNLFHCNGVSGCWNPWMKKEFVVQNMVTTFIMQKDLFSWMSQSALQTGHAWLKPDKFCLISHLFIKSWM